MDQPFCLLREEISGVGVQEPALGLDQQTPVQGARWARRWGEAGADINQAFDKGPC